MFGLQIQAHPNGVSLAIDSPGPPPGPILVLDNEVLHSPVRSECLRSVGLLCEVSRSSPDVATVF